jgi:ethanolamine kinase
VGCWLTDSDSLASSIDQVDTANILLIRIYGNNTELLIDRDAETKNIQLLQGYNYAPSLYATFQNGICYEYVKGVTLTPGICARSLVKRFKTN